jgi:inhibitor of KinA
VLGRRIRNDAVFYLLFGTFSGMGPTTLYRISEKAITLAWEEKIDPEIHRQVMYVDALISKYPCIGWVENVPAYHTLTIFYDPIIIRRQLGVSRAFPYIENFLSGIFQRPFSYQDLGQRELRVPVCYDLSLGYDLPAAAEILDLDIQEIIRLHSKTRYHVFMLGFLPGFPYMGILPEALTIPRKDVPLLHVPAGTVAIAGRQTGIYPVDSPGGWYAVGRTPIVLFREGKAYFEPGDMVEFYPISLEEFHQLYGT